MFYNENESLSAMENRLKGELDAAKRQTHRQMTRDNEMLLQTTQEQKQLLTGMKGLIEKRYESGDSNLTEKQKQTVAANKKVMLDMIDGHLSSNESSVNKIQAQQNEMNKQFGFSSAAANDQIDWQKMREQSDRFKREQQQLKKCQENLQQALKSYLENLNALKIKMDKSNEPIVNKNKAKVNASLLDLHQTVLMLAKESGNNQEYILTNYTAIITKMSLLISAKSKVELNELSRELYAIAERLKKDKYRTYVSDKVEAIMRIVIGVVIVVLSALFLALSIFNLPSGIGIFGIAVSSAGILAGGGLAAYGTKQVIGEKTQQYPDSKQQIKLVKDLEQVVPMVNGLKM